MALGEEPEHDPHVAGADRVLEHVEGERLEAGEALLAAEGGEVAEVLDEAAEVGPGEQRLGLVPGQALGAGGLGGAHAGGDAHAEAAAGEAGRAAGAEGRGHGGSE